ncbi:MAG: diaminopimelate epimerase [Flavobacteriia bacterium]|nr:diaminopimelate epimerase [Flavobacteriia bacterium]
MKLNFYKYQGTGNDFIIIENFIQNNPSFDIQNIPFLCDRKFGIGADGLIIMNKVENADFEVDYYNSDGTKSFCGNGARCAVSFAKKLGIISKKAHFLAIDGFHFAEMKEKEVYLQMNNVDKILVHKENINYELNTGSPHFIQFVENSLNIDVQKDGKKIRYSPQYNDEGINVNFVEIIKNQLLEVATYERGVENETLSCGTGVVASALAYSEKMNLNLGDHEIEVHTKGGHLKVKFEKKSSHYENIFLIGPAVFVFSGEIEV